MLKPADRLPSSPAKKKPCGCAGKTAARAGATVTRPSCLECVEKHLGAAWVLIAEHRDGYPHRLRAIGHLHEAEDESQAWPELHNAIRAARKAYQRAGHSPHFESLAALLQDRRGSAISATFEGAATPREDAPNRADIVLSAMQDRGRLSRPIQSSGELTSMANNGQIAFDCREADGAALPPSPTRTVSDGEADTGTGDDD